MTTILLQVLLLVVGFAALVKGADWFVDGASAVADRLGIPQLVIGLTIVAMGTSLPEAAISISAALKHSAGIAVGNVVGSNIMNILLILGITAVLTPLAVQKSTVRVEMPFMIGITVVFGLLGLFDEVLGLADGVILWVLFVAYLVYLGISAKRGNPVPELEEEDDAPKKSMPVWKMIVAILVGGALIVVGSDLTVDAATALAKLFGMSDRLIGLTIVAFGTSLPELVTSVTAGLKKKADIAIGNIVGSNVFNLLFVIGTSALITPVVYSRTFLIDTIACVATALLLFLLVVRTKKVKRWGGVVMLAAFVGYYAYLFLRV